MGFVPARLLGDAFDMMLAAPAAGERRGRTELIGQEEAPLAAERQDVRLLNARKGARSRAGERIFVGTATDPVRRCQGVGRPSHCTQHQSIH